MRGRKPDQIAADAGALNVAPSPPGWMAKDAKAEWRRILPDLVRRQTVTTSDLGSVESYCVAVGRVRELERLIQGAQVIDPRLFRLQNGAIQTARQLAAELGLTPVSRSRPKMVVPEHDEDSLEL
ncbi:P27 family phage terminase small subunit [Phreatobacter cathodiphilus]|uniref:Phage terminase small subunit P27 family n=1 Tax=Phreatobacter cathodiphilus TaxID=1868589 RepID=A0A2S0N7C5_9HYPH|nr:P27 family phage terminase small subunit [Phreatobacter cathodiphilus]AVO43907.1 phage terminase small subunit P27 family [Phreatobacter cathodiphilus]